MSDLFAKLMAEGQQQKEQVEAAKDARKSARKLARNSAPEPARNSAPEVAPELAHKSARAPGIRRELPTRDEIQEFSFQLRDESNVRVQAAVPPEWQDELEDIAHKLKVKRLELYRFILGEFLGKVQRRKTNPP